MLSNVAYFVAGLRVLSIGRQLPQGVTLLVVCAAPCNHACTRACIHAVLNFGRQIPQGGDSSRHVTAVPPPCHRRATPVQLPRATAVSACIHRCAASCAYHGAQCAFGTESVEAARWCTVDTAVAVSAT